MRLVNVYNWPDAAKVLYDLLKERTPEVNISHKQMPTWEEHRVFIRSRPYPYWYIIDIEGVSVGSVYLTSAREMGLFIFKAHRGKGIGGEVIAEIKRKHPGRLLANVSCRNADGIEFWKNQGFKLLSHTFEWSDNARPERR